MENKLIKFSIITGALIISLSVAYFFIFSLPNHLEKKEEFENNLKCQEAGWEMHKDHEKTLGTTLSWPLFKFSKSLNTCLYKWGIRGSGGYMEFIEDVNTNKRIIGCSCPFTKDGKSKCTVSKELGLVSAEDFEKKSRELFGY